MTLALEYRPRAFSDMVGQKPVRVVLSKMVESKQMPPALLFSGVRGTGKTTTARILAAALNCEHDTPPCGSCPSCKATFDGTSPDVIEVDAASNGLVGDIRRLREAVMYSVGGEWRVVLLDEVHSMSKEAFNALLKTLEEPPPQTVFVLLTTDPGKIIDTVVSRCMSFEFRKISTHDIEGRLEHVIQDAGLPPMTPELLHDIAERADGGMRNALMTLDQISRVGITTVEQFRKFVGDEDVAPPIINALLDGELAQAFALVDDAVSRTGDPQEVGAKLTRALRDVLVVSVGGDCGRQGDVLEVRRKLAARLDQDRVLAGCRVLWDLKTKVRPQDDQKSSLELAVIMLRQALLGASTSVQAKPAQRMSLAEMRQAVPA